MKAEFESINPVQRRVKVEVPSDDVNRAFDTSFRRIQKKARIQGFRPGKAPMNVLKKLYGASVAAEVAEQLIKDHLFEALQGEKIFPIATPVVEEVGDANPDAAFSFSAVIDIMPEVPVADYKGLALTSSKAEVRDEAVDGELKRLQRRAATTRQLPPEVLAGKGNLVKISHEAKVGGELQPGLTVSDLEVELGSHQLIDDLDQAFVGMVAGGEKDVSVTLPADYGDPDLAGKVVDFHLKLSEVKELVLPNMDDEFAKDLGTESLAKLKDTVRHNLQHSLEHQRRQGLETAVFEQLLNRHDFEVPPAMVDQMLDQMISQFGFQDDKQRDQALKNEQVRERLRPQARRQTQQTLLLLRVAEIEKMEVADEEIVSYLKSMLPPESKQDVKVGSKIFQQLRGRVREDLLAAKAMDFLIHHAHITELDAPANPAG